MRKRKRVEIQGRSILNNKKLIEYGMNEGLSVLLENNPHLKKYQNYLEKHIDQSRIKTKLSQLNEEMSSGGGGNYLTSAKKYEEKEKLFVEDIANYVSSGELLDERGKKLLLKRGGLEEKAKSTNPFTKFFAKRELKGEKYLENTIDAFQDLYSIFSSGDYAKRMPEIAEATQTVNDMGFLKPAIEILKDYGLMNNNKYKILKKAINEKTREGVETATKGIENYLSLKQAAIIVMGFIGAFIVFTSVTITGGVIGTLNTQSIKFAGALLCLIALILFLMVTKKKNKLKTFKNR
jgi:hypothetical protein